MIFANAPWLPGPHQGRSTFVMMMALLPVGPVFLGLGIVLFAARWAARPGNGGWHRLPGANSPPLLSTAVGSGDGITLPLPAYQHLARGSGALTPNPGVGLSWRAQNFDVTPRFRCGFFRPS